MNINIKNIQLQETKKPIFKIEEPYLPGIEPPEPPPDKLSSEKILLIPAEIPKLLKEDSHIYKYCPFCEKSKLVLIAENDNYYKCNKCKAAYKIDNVGFHYFGDDPTENKNKEEIK